MQVSPDLPAAGEVRRTPGASTERHGTGSLGRFVNRARSEGLNLNGENGLLKGLVKLVLEDAFYGDRATDHP